MGYTHYWYKIPKIEQKVWDDIIKDFNIILPSVKKHLELKDRLTDEEKKAGWGSQKLRVTKDDIFFNGIGENAHETFVFERVVDMNARGRLIQYNEPEAAVNAQQIVPHIFNFCKTARKPYDDAVTCALVVAKHHMKKDIKIHSDGDLSNWQYAKKKCQDKLGYGEKFKLDREEEQH